MSSAAIARIPLAQYLADEAGSLAKHEWLDGAVVAMAGGTPEHSLLKTRLSNTLGWALRGRPCQPFDSDLRVVTPSGLHTYPDLTVVCGAFHPHADDADACVNPTALFEVLSPNTATYDRTEKFDHYASIAGLLAYILVDSVRVRVEVWTRTDSETWAQRRFGSGKRFQIPPLNVELAVDDVYAGWAELREQLAASRNGAAGG